MIMRIFKFELLKICKNKFFLVCLAVLFFANLFYSMNTCVIDSAYDSGIKKIYNGVSNLNDDEKREYFAKLLNDSHLTDSEVRLTLAQEQHYQYLYISKYTNVIEERIEAIDNLNGVAFFNNGNAFQNNVFESDIEVYSQIKDRTVSYEVSYGVNTAIENFFTVGCIAVLMLIVSMYIISDEKSKGLYIIINTTQKGRGNTIVAKIFIMATTSVVITTLFYCSNLIVGGFKYGICNLNSYIQSLQGYLYSTLNVSIWQYLLLFLLVQILAVLVFALLTSLICLIAKSNIISYIVVAGIIGAEVGLYFLVSSDSPVNFLHFINLICAVNVTPLFKNSQYLNFFTQPVFANLGLIVALLIIIASLVVVLYITFTNQKSANWGKSNIFAKFSGKFFNKKQYSTNVFVSEMKRVFIKSRILLIIIAVLLVQQTIISFTPQKYDENEVRYHQYILNFGGELTQSKETQIYNEINSVKGVEKTLEDLKEQYESGKFDYNQYIDLCDKYQKEQAKLPAVLRLEKQMEYLNENNISYLIYETKYNDIFCKDSYNSDCINSIILAIMLVLCISQMFSNDNAIGMSNLIRGTANGRGRIFCCRAIITSIIGICSCLVVYVPYYANILGYGNFDELSQAMNSLQISNANGFGSIFDNILVLFLLRFLFVSLIGMVIMCISSFSKNNIISLIVSTVLVLSPLLFTLINSSLITIWLNPFFSVNALRETGAIQIVLTVAVMIFVIVFAYINWTKPIRLAKKIDVIE